MAKNIEYRDNTEEVLSALEAAIKRGNEAIGMTAEGHAKKKITAAGAVDTGRLRNSITYALAGEETHVKSYNANKGGKDRETYTYDGTADGKKGSGVYIGTNVEYAVFVENGAQGRTPVHFLQDAATGHTDEYKRLMEDSMKNA
jgi:hypothetical protein